jgi:hypothetical protein
VGETCSSPERTKYFARSRHVAVEHFDDGAVVLFVSKRRLIVLDHRQSQLVQYFDGGQTLAQVVVDYAASSGLSEEEALKTINSACEELVEAQVLVSGQVSSEKGARLRMLYLQNPDVNIREEDADGALLFDPDTNRIKLLNGTGLYIWKQCREPRTPDDIVASVKEQFEDVPENEIAEDVKVFLDSMVANGLLGVS